jgi:lipopolysaccharide/colanic/teichoic acid biosynthesis glycosyltransferase
VPWAVERYTPEERVILSVRPGITDWASLWVGDEGERLRGSTDPDRDYLEKIWPEKRRLQLEYIRTRSLAVDLVIVGKTIKSHIVDRLVPRRPRGHAA